MRTYKIVSQAPHPAPPAHRASQNKEPIMRAKRSQEVTAHTIMLALCSFCHFVRGALLRAGSTLSFTTTSPPKLASDGRSLTNWLETQLLEDAGCLSKDILEEGAER